MKCDLLLFVRTFSFLLMILGSGIFYALFMFLGNTWSLILSSLFRVLHFVTCYNKSNNDGTTAPSRSTLVVFVLEVVLLQKFSIDLSVE